MKEFLLSTILLCILIGCVKEEYLIDDTTDYGELTPSFAIPLLNSELTLSDLETALDDEDVVTQTDAGVLALVYSEKVLGFGVSDLLDIPALEAEGEFEADILVAAAFNANTEGEEFTFSQQLEFPFDFNNGEIIDSIRFQTADIDIAVNSTFPHTIIVVFTIPELTLDGEVFEETLVLDYEGSTPTMVDTEFDISNHLLDLSNSTTNGIVVDAQFTIVHSGETTFAGDRLDFSLELATESIEYAYGYLGQQVGIVEQDTQQVDLFENVFGGEFFFSDPALELTVRNSSGIPVEVNVSSIFNPDNAASVTVTGGALDDVPLIPGATVPGEVTEIVHRIDNENLDPDLSDLMSSGPFELIYTADATTNPQGEQQNWVTAESEVEIEAKFILPLSGYADVYAFSDTIPMNLGEGLGLVSDSSASLSTADIDTATLRLIFDNGLPIDAEVQVYFLDDQEVLLDSLFLEDGTTPIITSGQIMTSLSANHPDFGRVIAPTRQINDIQITQERLQFLTDANASIMVIRAKGNTTNVGSGQIVKFYPEYRLDVMLSARLDLKIDQSE